jgi:hypothetical protein
MIYFVKPDASAIKRIVYYSTLLRDIRLTLLQLRRTKLLIRNLGVTVPSFEDLNDVEVNLLRRAEEVKQASRLLLEPILEGIDFGHKRLDFWCFSVEDIKNGHCKLEEILNYDASGKPLMFGRRFILLLEDYSDETLGKFYAGELVPLEKAIHFIDKMPVKETKVHGLREAMLQNIEEAMKYKRNQTI